MTSTYAVTHTAARNRNADGIFYRVAMYIAADSPEEAETKFREQYETGGGKLTIELEPISRKAWTGGSSPPADLLTIPGVAAIVLAFYVEQCDDFATFWNEAPNTDTAGIFWNRAKSDAWATIRDTQRDCIDGALKHANARIKALRKGKPLP